MIQDTVFSIAQEWDSGSFTIGQFTMMLYSTIHVWNSTVSNDAAYLK